MGLKIAMVSPPTCDLNTPYAAAPRLAGWLRSLGHEVELLDLSLDLFLRVFSRPGLERLFGAIQPEAVTLDLEDTYQNRDRYLRIIDAVVAFAQGRDMTVSSRIIRGDYLPEGPRFRMDNAERRRNAFGEFGGNDLARHLISYMFGDLVDLFARTISPHYGMTQYGEALAESRTSFDPIEATLRAPRNEIEKMILEMAAERIPEDVDLVCFTVPFPGMLLSTLLIGKWMEEHRPRAKRVIGGGYPSTELRSMSDARFFDYCDYLVLDDGETPLVQIGKRLGGEEAALIRTFTRDNGVVVYHDDGPKEAPRFRDLPAPDYKGVDFDKYIHVLYRRNHVSRLISEGTWLKLTAAHGCYWKKCTFCDIHLSYIGDFDPASAVGLADQMDYLHEQTGRSGFHFTDEACPPSLLVKLALELLRRGRAYQFWGNIRYDTAFTPDRCRVLAAAGMVAVTGGIEIASDDLLPKIAKGITVHQVIKVLQAFHSAGIRTHAYLIYGFPGETAKDTVNSLELLRQMMHLGILQSAFYHKFTATVHSPIGKNPELFGIRLRGPEPQGFANYTREHELVVPEPRGHSIYQAVQGAVDSYARGEFFDRPVLSWFRTTDPMPPTTIEPDFVAKVMAEPGPEVKQSGQVCWLGGLPRWEKGLLSVACEDGEILTTPTPKWIADNLLLTHPTAWSKSPPAPAQFERQDWFETFRRRGLVII